MVGDCYYLAGMSALAQIPHRLLNGMLVKEKNNAGIFAQQIFLKGIPQVVAIDDWIPFYGKYYSAQYGWFITPYATTKSDDGSIWGLLSEKLFAKVMGNYERINAGYLSETWDFLTGIPSTYYSFTDASTINNDAMNLWDVINDAMKLQLVAALGTDSDNPYNLVPGHAYSIHGTYNYTDDTGATRLLARIRNPWGSDVYNASNVWGDNDTDTWTLNAKNFLPYKSDMSDGMFFMELSDVLLGFAGLYIGHFYDNYYNNYFEVTGDKGQLQTYNVTIPSAGQYFIGMHFYNPRLYALTCRTSSQYSKASLKIYSPAGTLLFNYLAADWAGFNFKKFDNLAAGLYKVTVQATWLTTDVPDFTVRVYADKVVNITQQVGKKITRSLSHPIIQNFSSRVNGTYEFDSYDDGEEPTQYNNHTEGEGEGEGEGGSGGYVGDSAVATQLNVTFQTYLNDLA